MNIFLLCPMADNQSGLYIHDTLVEMGHKVAFLDWRKFTMEKGIKSMNEEVIDAVKQLKPDLTIVIKGLGIAADTIKRMKEVHKHKILGWIFDVTLGNYPLYPSELDGWTDNARVKPYIEMFKELDIFYTIDEYAVEPLKKEGINAKYLAQACFEIANKKQIINSVQKKKYGADVVFIGSVGGIHDNRNELLARIASEGYHFKIYGDVLYPKDTEPDWVKNHHTGYGVQNDMFATVVNSSKIIIGMDGWPEHDKAWSLRLYKVLCAGGFYLNTHTKKIDEVFKLGEHLDTYKTEDDMIKKIDYYLSDDVKREAIGEAGRKEVLDKHQEFHRFEQIFKDIGKVAWVKTP